MTADRPQYLTCREAFDRLYEYLDFALPPDEEGAVRAHLDLCAGCLSQFQFEERLLLRIREKARSARAPEHLRDEIERLLDAL